MPLSPSNVALVHKNRADAIIDSAYKTAISAIDNHMRSLDGQGEYRVPLRDMPEDPIVYERVAKKIEDSYKKVGWQYVVIGKFPLGETYIRLIAENTEDANATVTE